MPFYKAIDTQTPAGKRTAERLLALRQQLDAEIPLKTIDETLLLGTWNIREFDSPAYGDRIPEAFYYIAEIIARFDLVAIQEVRQDLRALNKLMDILGGNWDYIFSDVTEGTQGNGERTAFLYDRRKVKTGGLMGQLVLPPIELKGPDGKTIYQPLKQIVRTPLICGFKVGWTDFILTTVHIIYGDGKANDPDRVEEIRQIAQALKRRSEDSFEWSRNLILLGDFNIFSPQDETMKQLTDAGFVVPPELQHLPSNVDQSKFYDQIAFRIRPGRFTPTGKAGVFNFYKTVFRPEDEAIYAPDMGKAYTQTSEGKARQNTALYYRNYWRTFQMSDHLPMWVEIKVDFSNDYLKKKLEPVDRGR
ncbi:MAG: endonuclease/exonuclease/phosphatase family protein [Phaeodactylibacter sp.]|nr:endonuclease/exonuclease/phosphatase family protein [Phaeodactylibacter sp.]MCB9303748.1 endonuclease/exonuclease/phosphatase family protein [Lewinellaceae bacterium]